MAKSDTLEAPYQAGSNPGKIKLTEVDFRQRWDKSWEAWNYEIDKFTLTEKWYRAYEKHIRVGEDWQDSFRFPELFGAINRKYDNLVEFLPEMRVRGDGDGVIALQASYDHQMRIGNIAREKQRALMDAIKTGVGAVFVAPVRYERQIADGTKQMFYDGLGAERIDPRDIIPAHSALVLHDHTGQAQCPYLFRRRLYTYTTFLEKYSGKQFQNVDKVQPVSSYEGSFSGDRTLTQREGIEKETGNYVTVLEYWDQELDILRVFANSFNCVIYDSPVGIPYSHKQIPIHFYYNYRREDSIAGVGEVELRMSYNLFRESVLNLMIDNIKLELQPAYIVDGDINFNTEETELEPGAIFTVRGMDGGKLQDSIMPFRAGGVTADVPTVINMIDDSMISATGDDTRALYANPNQLATQTLAKREALQKRSRATVLRNTVETEFYLANQVVSYLQNELAKPYKKNGKTTYRKIQINGYQPIQDKKESKVEFEKMYGVDSEFFLNQEVAEMFEDIEIEVVSDKMDEEIKRDQTEKLMMFMQQVMITAQTDPSLLQGMDLAEFLKELSGNLGLDVHKIYPPADKSMEDIDRIDAIHKVISMGISPEVDPELATMKNYMAHVEFEKSSVFKKLGKKAHDAMSTYKTKLLIAIKDEQIQKVTPNKPQQGGVETPTQTSQQSPIQGMAPASPGQMPPGGTGISPQGPEGGLRQGQGERATQANPVTG